MSPRAQIIVVFICLLFAGMVLELLQKRKLSEQFCLLWLFIAAVSIFLTVNQRLLKFITSSIGALVPVSTLTLLSLVFIVAMLIYFSMQISLLAHQVKELTQSLALLKKDCSRLP
jgi:hypothetical protein